MWAFIWTGLYLVDKIRGRKICNFLLSCSENSAKCGMSLSGYTVVQKTSWTLGVYSGGKNKLNTILHKIGKSAVAQSKLWIEKWLIPHLKALNVSFNLKHQTFQKMQGY